MDVWDGPSPLDRSGWGRSEPELDSAWQEGEVWLIDASGRVAALAGRPHPLTSPGPRTSADLFLGISQGRGCFARMVRSIDGEFVTWREAPPDLAAELAAGVALVRWHLTSPVCESCGGATVPDLGGAQRRCTTCRVLVFPRTDPCVIVAVTDPDDRLLLAHQRQWAPGRVSVIAGFMEAGESAEQAVHREAAEEVSVRLVSLTYVASQPWPMPRSLMLGFEARAEDAAISVDGDEIASAAYYTRAELLAAVESGQVVLPGEISIARRLIRRWLSRG